MPSFQAVPRRRPRVEDDDDSDDVSSSEATRDPTPLSQVSNGSKRPRLGENTQEETDEEETSDDQSTANEREPSSTAISAARSTQVTPARRSMGGSGSGAVNGENQGGTEYKPGSIVRIKVTNFVTYTSAEFFPGPKLNMVIGPNGTGKSTLVCAICLGLGWGPQHLGRAKDPGEFVKHGCREATIEIELAGGPRHRRNPVISRTIKRDGNKSTFTLNGQMASRTKILDVAKSFAIQIDNLCQFLPQDKVSEFAALTPIELLYSTQRAAAGPEMVEWHDNLKNLRAEQKRLQADNQGDRDLLANLENRQEMQRADVERMRQRTQIIRKIEMLEFLRPIMRYREIYSKYEEMRAHKNQLARELENLKAELAPVLGAVNRKQEYCLKINEVVVHKKHGVEEAETTASELGRQIEQYEDQMKDLERQIEAEKKRGLKYRQDSSSIQQAINRLRRQLSDEPVEFDVDWYNEQIRQKRHELRELQDKATQIKEDRRPLFEALKQKGEQVRQAEQQLQSLDSQSGRQENKLRQASLDTFRAYEWLKNNQNKFEKEVFGPPMVTCSVKDPKYADAIESLMQRTDFLAFTVQTRNDFKTLQRALNIEQKLHDISIKTSSTPLSNFSAPMPDAELRRLGFDAFARDLLTGPEPVISVFCSENRLHQTPISHRDISDEQYHVMESGPISSWVAGRQTYQVIRRREYGPGATSTRVRQVKPAKVWTSGPVDTSVKEDLVHQVQELREEMHEIEKKMESEKDILTSLGREYQQCEDQMNDLEKEKGEKQTALVQFRAIPEKINQQEIKLRDNQRYFDELKARVWEFRHQQSQVSIQKAESAIEYANAVGHLRDLHEEFIKLSIRHIEGLSDLETLKTRNADYQAQLDAKHNELKEVVSEVRATGDQVKRMLKEADKVIEISASQPDLRELTQELVEYTIEQLEADIGSEKARLELTQGGSKNLIKEFEEREKQIGKLQSKLADFQQKLSDYEHAIDEIRGQWEPKLDALIKSISEAFSDSFARIGCAGQVSLDKVQDEPGPDGQPTGSDFDQWSIQIHVKFRENENLSLLDSHRQSGGERAVSTIFYLMALQSLSASPFRVVDEINQGMDPRNERMVHERLVDIACASSGSDETGAGGGGQYFLITPKLLSGLVYKPGMRVLCIFSGEHMPTDYNLLDFKQAVKRMRAVAEKRDRGKGKGRALGPGGGSSNGIDVYA